MRKLINAVLGAVATVAAPNAFGADGGLPGSTTPATTDRGLPGATTPATTDRAAVERIYYEHRLGTKPAFEQTLPPAQIEKMVKLDLKKEAVLKRVYKIDISQAEIDAEVQRINSTTRAPDVLGEIKTALGNDPKRFADAVARPIVVERKLREKFENDAKLHAPQRVRAEQIRNKLLATKDANKRLALLKAVAAVADRGPRSTTSTTTSRTATLNEVTWQLAGKPAQKSDVGSQTSEVAASPTKIIAKSANYSIEATTQVSQPLSTLNSQPSTLSYFEDLDPELQKVLRAQLQKSGDVSAVMETPSAFLLFVAKEKTNDALSVASLSIPKRSYDEWLNQQPEKTP